MVNKHANCSWNKRKTEAYLFELFGSGINISSGGDLFHMNVEMCRQH